ncbi:group III truncated hemoglobin [Roseibium denhamense]|uniref:Hemoglobin n=1 Tax=Roseibium denhamense TaxID=76305 RepID=A0ABY1P547_9HYPH|nr:group III truncated hemoglobin [Roseibium denhamense]SMP24383.1 hemoglobin [Roseibium denhamense]
MDARQSRQEARTGLQEQLSAYSDRLTRFEEITPEAVHVLVHTFYGCVRQHPRLGEIFERRLEGQWPAHLAKMESFWQSVLLKNGAYKGRPVPVHLKQKELVSADYGEWLDVFRPIANALFVPEKAEEIISVAERIAQSLWYACFGTAGAAAPASLSSRS